MRSVAAMLGALALLAGLGWARQIEGGFERTLAVSGPVDLDVTTDAGGISVKAGTAGSVQIRAILRGQRGRWSASDIERKIRTLEQNPPIEQSGNTIRVGYVSDKDLIRGVSMRFEILTPAETKLRARTDSGGVRVAGIRGPVDSQTDSGGIEASDIASEVRAVCDSGGVRMNNVRGPVFARADSGGIEALNVAGPIDIETDSGGIQVSQTVAAPIRARADSGGATVKLAPGAGYDINVAAGSGRVTVPAITVRGTLTRHRVEGKIGGGGPLVDIRVDSGSVRIE